jgi:hypothetical protein
MSLCRLMQFDFMDGTGRYCPETDQELYSDQDLAYGRQYALDYLAAGETHEPLMGFDLRAFAEWCAAQLSRCSRE